MILNLANRQTACFTLFNRMDFLEAPKTEMPLIIFVVASLKVIKVK